MTVQIIMIDGQQVLVEVEPNEAGDAPTAPAGDGMQNTSVLEDTGLQMQNTVQAVLAPVSRALSQAQPEEWSVELTLGFKGSAGIPFLTSGEANGSLKVTAKWKRAVTHQ